MNIEHFFSALSSVFSTGKQDKVVSFLTQSLDEAEEGKDTHAVITILNEMAGYYRAVSNFPASIAAGERALSLLHDIGHADSSEAGTTFLNLATAYHAAGDNQKALRLYEAARDMYEKYLPASDQKLAGLYNNLGSVYLATEQDEDALQVLQKSLVIIQGKKSFSAETATVYTNLALALLRLKKHEEALQVLRTAIKIFDAEKRNNYRYDPHYAAALAAQGQICYSLKEYNLAIQSYLSALEHIKACYGENKDFATTCDNCSLAYEALGNKEKAEEFRKMGRDVRVHLLRGQSNNAFLVEQEKNDVHLASASGGRMSGLGLAWAYYEAYGKDMLRERFFAYKDRIAVGLSGEGSECFGFDDEISEDHDFGPCFCMWLTRSDYEAIGASLHREYASLPQFFMGKAARKEGSRSEGRIGAICIDDFFKRQIGRPNAQLTLMDWLRIPESRLAVVTNGQVFYDPLGAFSSIRDTLLEFYPEDVRLKKIAARAALMGQSGQYNYARSMARKEPMSALLALAEFVRQTGSMVYLLNKRYMPFYKWMHRGMQDLPLLREVEPLLRQLACVGLNESAWDHKAPASNVNKLNFDDDNIRLIEEICGIIKKELRKSGLSSCNDDFLTNHAEYIMQHISDETIKSLHIMES